MQVFLFTLKLSLLKKKCFWYLNVRQTSTNPYPDSTFVDEANSTMLSFKPKQSQFIKHCYLSMSFWSEKYIIVGVSLTLAFEPVKSLPRRKLYPTSFIYNSLDYSIHANLAILATPVCFIGHQVCSELCAIIGF